MPRSHPTRQSANGARHELGTREQVESRMRGRGNTQLLVRSFWVLVREAGVDIDALAARAGFPPDALDKPLASARVNALLTAVSAELPPTFGLRAGADLRPELLGTVGLLATSSPTFGAALERLARYKRAVTGDRLILLRRAGRGSGRGSSARTGETVVRIELGDRDAPYVRHKLDWELAFLVALGRRLTRAHLRPVGVAVELPRPADDSEYTSLFDCPIAFDRPSTEIVFRDEDLARPLVSARVELASVLEEHAERRLGEGADGAAELTSRLRLVLRGGLRGDVPEIGRVARQIGMSGRTLQRQLQAEGSSFARILDEVRFELAERYLRSGQSAMAEIAFLLSFSHRNSFYRAFKRWSGMTPEAYRSKHRAMPESWARRPKARKRAPE